MDENSQVTHSQPNAEHPQTGYNFVPDQPVSADESSEPALENPQEDQTSVDNGFTPENDAEIDSQSAPEGPVFSWQASEFIHHQKKGSWYGIFAVIVVALIVIGIITKQVLSVMVFVAMGGAVAVYANKEPRVLEYLLDNNGITVGEKLYRYDQFRSFAVFNDVAWHSIDLDPLQRFQPRLTVMFQSQDLTQIEGILSAHLPRIDRDPDIIERLTRTLKF